MIYNLYFPTLLLGTMNFMSIVLVSIVFMVIFKKFIAAHRQPVKV